jgi:hypothetical protein
MKHSFVWEIGIVIMMNFDGILELYIIDKLAKRKVKRDVHQRIWDVYSIHTVILLLVNICKVDFGSM